MPSVSLTDPHTWRIASEKLEGAWNLVKLVFEGQGEYITPDIHKKKNMRLKSKTLYYVDKSSMFDTAHLKCSFPMSGHLFEIKERSRAYSSSMARGSSHCFEWLKSTIVTPESLTRIFSRRISPWSVRAMNRRQRRQSWPTIVYMKRGFSMGVWKLAYVRETYQWETDKLRPGSSRSEWPA